MIAADAMPNNRILVIDDNPAIFEDIRKILTDRQGPPSAYRDAKSRLFGSIGVETERMRFDLDYAAQGGEGLRMAEAAAGAGRPYALAFVDVRMPPGLDGVETVGLLWKTCPDLQIVMISAYSDYAWPDLEQKLKARSNFVILKKPFDNIEVLQLAFALTEKWQLARDMKLQMEDLDRALAQRTLELQASHDQLVQAQKMESLGRLAGGVAHDMNNVLGAILSLASVNLEIQAQGSATHRAFGTIVKAAERGSAVVKSLLTFARENPAESRLVDLNDVIREEIELLERTTMVKVRFQLDLDPELRSMRGDAGSLSQVFMNLCINSVDAMAENGILVLRTRNLPGESIEAEVEDDGCGMARDVLDRALDPFFTTKEAGKGTGLGLSMVYRTVKAHDGQLELVSEPGRGTLVRMRFPACDAGEAPAPGHPEDAVAPAGASPMEVLLVDDDELMRGTLADVLDHLGHAVTAADCGEEALARLEGGYRPDVVILDLNMPGLGGAGTLPLLRRLCPETPVLLATGRTDQAALDLIGRFDHVTLVPKPFGIAELRRQLSKRLPPGPTSGATDPGAAFR